MRCLLSVPGSAGEFRRLRAGGVSACGRRGGQPETAFSLSLRKRKRGFRLPQKRKGLVGNACPNTRSLNCPLNVPAPPARHFRNLPMPATHIVPNERGNKALPCARRGPPGAGIRGKSVRHEDKQRAERRTAAIRFMKSSAKKGSLETLVSSGFLVTFSPPEKVTRSRGAELPRPLAARRRRNTSSTFRRREKSALRLTASPQGEAFGGRARRRGILFPRQAAQKPETAVSLPGGRENAASGTRYSDNIIN